MTTTPLPDGVIILPLPASVMHDFENRTRNRAGALNVFIPGGFEANMPAIVEWFRAQGQETTFS